MEDTAQTISEEPPVSPQKLAVLEQAQLLFTQQGYAGLSIRDLAEHCGLAKATIYHHFRDKGDLFFSVLQHELTGLHRALMEAAAKEAAPLDQLQAVLREYDRLLRARRSGMLWGIHENPEIKAQLAPFFKTHEQMLLQPWMQIIEQGQAEGVFRAADVRLCALSLLAMLNALVVFQTRVADSGVQGDVVDHVFTLFVQGIKR